MSGNFQYLFLGLLCPLIFGCFLQLSSHQPPSTQSSYVFLDSASAAQAITLDTMDGFFETISLLDINIQTKTAGTSTSNRQEALANYAQSLQKEVRSFNAAEREKINTAFQKVYSVLQKNNYHYYQDSIQLIKVAGYHYGPFAFYTRNAGILIPESALAGMDEKALVEVLTHELSHINTRYDKVYREALYHEIGFFPIPERPQLPPELKEILLLNPDGAHSEYALWVQTPEGDSLLAIPLLTSTFPKYLPARKGFFQYLQFNLFTLQNGTSNQVVCTPDGSPLYPLKDLSGFFEQISDNTSYYIHPDEVIAEHFKFCVSADLYGKKSWKHFSDEGKELLARLAVIFKPG